MLNIKFRILLSASLAFLATIIIPTEALAQAVLPVSRGGTGASSFTNGSIPFIWNGVFSEDNGNFFWDNTNKRLGIGTSFPTSTLDVFGNALISEGLQIKGALEVVAVNEINFSADDTFTNQLIALGSPAKNQLSIGTGAYAVLDVSPIIFPDKTFTFPNANGTFGLLEVNQTWSGLNTFEASSNSTIYVGSSIKSGCIALGDSDGSGITYVTVNDGIITASTTKPSICQ